MDIPTHYHNDGSYLYMLTPSFLPPSTDDVNRWLLHDGSHDNAMESQESSADACNEPHLNSVSTFSLESNLDHAKKLALGSHAMEPWTCKPRVPAVLQTEENTLQPKQHSVSSQDISQLSGLEGKSKLTPLSQAGFRDPASIGAGQQLTMFSIEVQAESRGDLRPDPRFDAVNFIAIVIPEDDESIINSYVLLCSEMASVRRFIAFQEAQGINQTCTCCCCKMSACTGCRRPIITS